MIKNIIKLINQHNPQNKSWTLPIWFSHTIQSPHISPFNQEDFLIKWGDIGIIPTSLTHYLSQLKTKDTETLKQKIISEIHNNIALKWRLKFFAIYNKALTVKEICDKKIIKKFQ